MECYIHREESHNGALARLYNNLPRRPYWGNGKRIQGILPKDQAVKKEYIQINHPLLIRYIVFDLDYAGSAFSWDRCDLPPFTFVVVNKYNAHCHGIYEIDPVFMGTASKKTLRLLKKICSRYKEILQADKVITSQKQLVKNPLHPHWEVICYGGVYTLSELYEYIPRIPASRRQSGKTISPDPSGRNVTLFNSGRFYAYNIVPECKTDNELYMKVESYLKRVNEKVIPEHFQFPLPYPEVKTITKSITRWVWERRNNFKGHRRNKYHTGVMGFEKIKGLPPALYRAEVKRRQSLSGKRTSTLRREKTLHLLTQSYMALLTQTKKVTQKMVSDDTGYCLRTVKYYWHKIIKGAKRSNQDNSRSYRVRGIITYIHSEDEAVCQMEQWVSIRPP